MNIVNPIHHHAQLMSASMAIILPDGGLTWAQLDAAIWRSAAYFAAQGIATGDSVGLAFENSVLHLLAALGLAKIGALQVALPYSETAGIREKTSHFFRLTCIITDAPEKEPLNLPVVRWRGFPDLDEIPVAEQISYAVSADDGWLVIQSSGTTGHPKYAALNHRVSLERHARWRAAYGYRQGDVFWTALSINTITGKQHIISALQAGVAVCIPAGFPSYAELIKFVSASGTTLAYAIPSILAKLIKLSDGRLLLPNVRRLYTGTTESSADLNQAIMKKLTPNFFINYGTNEAPCVTVASPLMHAKTPGSVGIAHASIDVEIVDDHEKVLATGLTGQIRIRGPGIINHYFQNPDASQIAFRNGWFYPGDLAYKSQDQEVVLQGRIDDMMIYDGINIYPLEIERALCLHPKIEEAVAFALSHDDVKDLPVAAVRISSALNGPETFAWIQHQLGNKSPKKIFIVDDFPRNASGKILRREMPALFDSKGRGLG